jgi:peptidylprolyl isomerase
MSTVRAGDCVQVHFVKRFQNGAVTRSRKDSPLELTAGVTHSRLPGLGTALVGLAPGGRATVAVPPEEAYGPRDPLLVRRLARSYFAADAALAPGKWVRATDRRGHKRLVRIVKTKGQVVIADLNHPWAGQSMVIEVEVIAVTAPPTS